MKMKLISVSIWCDHDKFMFLYTHQCLAIFRALEMWLQRSTILHQHLALTWRMSKSRQPRREALMRIRNHQCLRLRQSWLDSSHVENSSFAMLHLPSLAAPTRSTYCFEPSSQCQSWANNTGRFMENLGPVFRLVSLIQKVQWDCCWSDRIVDFKWMKLVWHSPLFMKIASEQ